MSTIGVVGVGAIGGYVAARLAAAGHDVQLCARRPFERLVVETPDQELTIDGPALTDPADAVPVEWALLATKAQHNATCHDWLCTLCDDDTHGVLVLQNGIDGTAIAPVVQPTPVIPTVVLIGAEQLAPGHVRHHGSSRLQVAANHAPAIASLFARTGIAIDPTDDFVTAAWRKLLLNALGCALPALTGRRLEVFHDPDIARLALGVAYECVTVARASGARLDQRDAESALRILQAQPPTMGSSMYYDRISARPMEHETITGAIVREGSDHGVPTPINTVLLALLAAIDRAARAG